MSAGGNENLNDNVNDSNDNNIIFAIKDTKLYAHVVILSARDNHKLSKLLSKGFERSVYWREYKTNRENKTTTSKFSISSNQILLESIDYLL